MGGWCRIRATSHSQLSRPITLRCFTSWSTANGEINTYRKSNQPHVFHDELGSGMVEQHASPKRKSTHNDRALQTPCSSRTLGSLQTRCSIKSICSLQTLCSFRTLCSLQILYSIQTPCSLEALRSLQTLGSLKFYARQKTMFVTNPMFDSNTRIGWWGEI